MLNLIRDALRLAQLSIEARLAVLKLETAGVSELADMDQTQYTGRRRLRGMVSGKLYV